MAPNSPARAGMDARTTRKKPVTLSDLPSPDEPGLSRTERKARLRALEVFHKGIEIQQRNRQAEKDSQRAKARPCGFTRSQLRHLRRESGLTRMAKVHDWVISQICLKDPTKKRWQFRPYNPERKKVLHPFGRMTPHHDRSGLVKNSQPLAA